MSSNDAKRRRIHDRKSPAAPTPEWADGETASLQSLAPEIASEIEALMAHLKNKSNDIERLTTRVEELEHREARALNAVRELSRKVGGLETRLSTVSALEKRCKILEQRCVYLERTVQLSVTEDDNRNTCVHQRWSSNPPPCIPTRHWQNRGFDENYIGCARSFILDLASKSFGFRTGISYEDISLGNKEGGPILLHDDILLPNWREIADALQICHYSWEYERFSLSNIQLSSEVLEMLAPSMTTKQFRSFEMNRNEFVDVCEGIDFAIESIRNNSKLETFTWSNNSIRHVTHAKDLLKAIRDHPSVNRICLEGTFGNGGIGYGALCSIITKENLEYLDMDSNNIRTMGNTHISDFLSTNPPLEDLYLSNNKLNDEDAFAIARALKNNTKLKRLHLAGNYIKEVGCAALRDAIFDASNFNSVADSNHICRIEGLSFDPIYNNDYDRGAEAFPFDADTAGIGNKQKKIRHFLLCMNRHCLIVYHLNKEFGEDALKLAPKILNCICRNLGVSEERWGESLSCMYEIIHGWQMPNLCEKRRAP